jgi:hypothetical protein
MASSNVFLSDMLNVSVYDSLSHYFLTQLELLEKDHQATGTEEQIIRFAITVGFLGNGLLGTIEGCFRRVLGAASDVIDVVLYFTDSNANINSSALLDGQGTSLYSKHQFFATYFLFLGSQLSIRAAKSSLEHVANNFKDFYSGKNT